MEERLRPLAANKAQGRGSARTRACVFAFRRRTRAPFELINYHQYTCLCFAVSCKSSAPPPTPRPRLCLSTWAFVYYRRVVPRPSASSKALLKCFPPETAVPSRPYSTPTRPPPSSTETARAAQPSVSQVPSHAGPHSENRRGY